MPSNTLHDARELLGYSMAPFYPSFARGLLPFLLLDARIEGSGRHPILRRGCVTGKERQARRETHPQFTSGQRAGLLCISLLTLSSIYSREILLDCSHLSTHIAAERGSTSDCVLSLLKGRACSAAAAGKHAHRNSSQQPAARDHGDAMGTPTTTTMIQTQMQPSLSISTASAAAAASTSGSAALRSRPATPVLTTTPSPMDDGNEPFYARGGSEQHVIHDYFSKGAHFVDRSGSTRQLSDPGANGRARIAKADRSSGSSGAQHDHHHHQQQQQQHRRPQKDAKASQHGSPTRALSLGHGRSSSVAATGGSRSRSPAATAAAQSSTSTSHSSYGGILSSRPSSRASRPSSPRASTSADEDGRLRLTRVSSRPSARSPAVLQQQHHPHHHAGASSPLLADMHDRRLSTSHHQNHSHAGHLRRHSLASGIARAHLALGRTKASLGIGTGEWTDSRTGRWRTPERLRAYIPLVVWVIVSVVMALVVAVWHEQVFSGGSHKVALEQCPVWWNTVRLTPQCRNL